MAALCWGGAALPACAEPARAPRHERAIVRSLAGDVLFTVTAAAIRVRGGWGMRIAISAGPTDHRAHWLDGAIDDGAPTLAATITGRNRRGGYGVGSAFGASGCSGCADVRIRPSRALHWTRTYPARRKRPSARTRPAHAGETLEVDVWLPYVRTGRGEERPRTAAFRMFVPRSGRPRIAAVGRR